MVLTEFLPLICGEDLIGALVEVTPLDADGNEPRPEDPPARGVSTRRRVRSSEFYRPDETPFIPIEWSAAAYRYGHSQIRDSYNLNPFLAAVNPDIEIFVETPTEENRLRHLGGGRQLPAFWTLDWRFFFSQNPPGTPDDQRVTPQATRLLDVRLSRGLRFLPGITEGRRFLANCNLQRGRAMGLPSGQAVARRLGVQPLSAEELRLGGAEAPLWFYVLREAERRRGGAHLGPVGGRIVAEVLLGIMAGDPFSFLRTEPTWEPVLPAPISGGQDRWSMADLLAYAIPDDGRRFPPPGPGPQ